MLFTIYNCTTNLTHASTVDATGPTAAFNVYHQARSGQLTSGIYAVYPTDNRGVTAHHGQTKLFQVLDTPTTIPEITVAVKD